MFSRLDYIQNKCTHHQYYEQFLNDNIVGFVRSAFPEGVLKGSKDPHFNDIDLYRWDRLAPVVISLCAPGIFKKITGSGNCSLSDTVCIAKTAAKRIRDGE